MPPELSSGTHDKNAPEAPHPGSPPTKPLGEHVPETPCPIRLQDGTLNGNVVWLALQPHAVGLSLPLDEPLPEGTPPLLLPTPPPPPLDEPTPDIGVPPSVVIELASFDGRQSRLASNRASPAPSRGPLLSSSVAFGPPGSGTKMDTAIASAPFGVPGALEGSSSEDASSRVRLGRIASSAPNVLSSDPSKLTFGNPQAVAATDTRKRDQPQRQTRFQSCVSGLLKRSAFVTREFDTSRRTDRINPQETWSVP
jgi:hypothetical protein